MVHPLTRTKFTRTLLIIVLGKKAFGWIINYRDLKESNEDKTYCFFLHKLWTYFNQSNNFKQRTHHKNKWAQFFSRLKLVSFLYVFILLSFIFPCEYKVVLRKFARYIYKREINNIEWSQFALINRPLNIRVIRYY